MNEFLKDLERAEPSENELSESGGTPAKAHTGRTGKNFKLGSAQDSYIVNVRKGCCVLSNKKETLFLLGGAG